MSLIDEALKRARMEAAQKAAEGEGLPYPTIPRHLGPRRRTGWLVPAVIALAVVAGVVVGLLLASRGGSREELTAENVPSQAALGDGSVSPPTAAAMPPAAAGPAAASPSAASPSPPASASPQPIGSSAPSAPALAQAAAPAPEPEPVAPSSSSPVVAAPSTRGSGPRISEPPISRPPVSEPAVSEPPISEPTGTVPAATGVDRSPPVAPPPAGRPEPPAAALTPRATAPPERSASTTTLTDPDSGVLLVLPEPRSAAGTGGDTAAEEAAESYAQQYPLASGGIIELGGIAWSETGPFALINGRVVSPGTVIEGYTLDSIRPGHVVLTGEGRRIRLSLQ